MAITSKNQRQIAYKKLVGKSHSTPLAGAIEEPYASSVQSFSSVIFGQTPTDNIAELVEFILEPLNSSVYKVEQSDIANDIGDNINSSPVAHGYRLKFPSTYAASGFYKHLITANNPDLYVDSELYIQIVPVAFGSSFAPILRTSSGETIEPDGNQDWILDCFSGILFMQDVLDKTPYTLTAYVYTGKYLDEMVEEAASSGGSATPDGSSGQIQFHNGLTPAGLGASSDLSWDNANKKLDVNGNIKAINFNTSGFLSFLDQNGTDTNAKIESVVESSQSLFSGLYEITSHKNLKLYSSNTEYPNVEIKDNVTISINPGTPVISLGPISTFEIPKNPGTDRSFLFLNKPKTNNDETNSLWQLQGEAAPFQVWNSWTTNTIFQPPTIAAFSLSGPIEEGVDTHWLIPSLGLYCSRGNDTITNPVLAGDTIGRIVSFGNAIGGYAPTFSWKAGGYIDFIASSNFTDSVYGSHITFYTANNASATEKMRITSNGNVGIGTTEPGEKLEVDGNVKANGNLKVGGNDSINYIAFHGTTGDAPGEYHHSFIAERIYEAETEKSELLIFKANDISTTYGKDRIRLAAAEIRFDTYIGSIGGSGPLSDYVDHVNVINRMVVAGDGKVGIGIDPTEQKLEVDGNVKATAFIGDLTGTADNADKIKLSDAADNYNSWNVTFSYINPNSTYHYQSYDSVFEYYPSSNTLSVPKIAVNIGTQAGYNLYVNGATYLAGDVETNGSFIGDGSQLTGIAAGSNGQIQFKSGTKFEADQYLHWNNTQKSLGIGTASPTERLEVDGNLKIATTGKIGVNTSSSPLTPLHIRQASQTYENGIRLEKSDNDKSYWDFYVNASSQLEFYYGGAFYNVKFNPLGGATFNGNINCSALFSTTVNCTTVNCTTLNIDNTSIDLLQTQRITYGDYKSIVSTPSNIGSLYVKCGYGTTLSSYTHDHTNKTSSGGLYLQRYDSTISWNIFSATDGGSYIPSGASSSTGLVNDGLYFMYHPGDSSSKKIIFRNNGGIWSEGTFQIENGSFDFEINPGSTWNASIGQYVHVSTNGNIAANLIAAATEIRLGSSVSMTSLISNSNVALILDCGAATYARDIVANLVVKKSDAHIQIASSDNGNWGSALTMTNGNYHWFIHAVPSTAGNVSGVNTRAKNLEFRYHNDNVSEDFISQSTLKAYIIEDPAFQNKLLNFTGQHRNKSDTINTKEKEKYLGLIVVSDGTYASIQSNSITLNEALPKVSLSSKRNQKSVFGVVSDAEDENAEIREYALGNFVSVSEKTVEDTRLIINSLGEGGIWVTNVNGNLENGDYITTCEIPGYGMKQDDDLLHNYTVAKITCDCDFSLESPIYICEEFEHEGTMYKRAFVGCTYHCG